MMMKPSPLHEYEVSLQSEARYPANPFETLSSPSASTTPPTMVTLNSTLRYRLQLVALPTPSGWRRAEWRNWQITGAMPQDEWRRLAAQVSSWYYRARPDGVVEILQTASDTLERHALRASATWFLQWVPPKTGKPHQWTSQEPYVSGDVVCEYRIERQTRTETTYRKRFVRFANPELGGGRTQTLSGELRYTLRNRDGVILSASGTLREATKFQDKTISESVNRLQMRLVRERPANPHQVRQWSAQLERQRAQARLRTVVSLPTPEEERIARARSLLGQRTISELISEIKALDSLSNPEQSQLITFQLALEGAFVLKPEPTRRFAQAHLAQATMPTPSVWVVLGALSADEQASAVLLHTLLNNPNKEIQLIVVRQMALLSQVKPTEFSALWNHYQEETDLELRSAIGLTLSAWVSALPDSTTSPFLDHLQQQAEQAEAQGDETQWRYWIGAIANTRRPRFLPLLERWVRRGSEPIREAVTDALSPFVSPETTQLLMRLASIEPTPSVRAKIGQALCQRWTSAPEVRREVERLLFNDPDTGVRTALVEALVGVSANDADALRLLVRASRENSDEQVRRRALIALASLHAQGVQVPKE